MVAQTGPRAGPARPATASSRPAPSRCAALPVAPTTRSPPACRISSRPRARADLTASRDVAQDAAQTCGEQLGVQILLGPGATGATHPLELLAIGHRGGQPLAPTAHVARLHP